MVKQAFLNPRKGQKKFAKGQKKVSATKEVTFPIHLDMPVDQTAKLDVQQAGSFKQTVEETLGKENVCHLMLSNFLQTRRRPASLLCRYSRKKTTILTSQDGVEITRSEDLPSHPWSRDRFSVEKTWACLKEKTRKSRTRLVLLTIRNSWIRQMRKSPDTQARYENMLMPKLGWQIVPSSYQFKVVEPTQSSVRLYHLQAHSLFVGNKGNADNYKYVELQKRQ